ncbi:MAG: ABC transporter substrate-binding protein, partial [Nitrospinota bacterium]
HGIKNWKHVVMAPTAKNPSLLAGKVDTICTFTNIGPILRKGAKKQGAKIHAITFTDWGLDLAGTGVIAPEKTVRGKKDLVQRFVQGTFKGLAWAVENPDDAVGIFLRLHPAKGRKITRAEWDVWARHLVTDAAKKNGIGYMDPKKMARTVNIAVDYMKLPPVKTEDLFTNEFLPKLFPVYKPLS